MACSLFVSQLKPCIGSKCQPKLHQVTTCHRHHTFHADHPTTHHFCRSSIGPPAILEQPLWNLNRSHQQCPAGNCRPNPEIESALPICTGMNRHEQTAITTHGEGMALAASYLHTTLEPAVVYHVPQKSGTEDRRPETQDSGLLLTGYVIFTVCSCNFSLLPGLLYLCTACVLSREM